MTVLAAELKVYKSTVITDDGTNGARMSSNEVVSGVANNVFPNVFTAKRVSGETLYRKTFCKVGNDADETLYYFQVWLDILTTGDDWVVFFVGTDRDVQSGILPDTEHKYGVADLYPGDVSSGVSTFDVDVEDTTLVSGNDAIFTVGDQFRITDKATIGGAGNEEIHTLTGVTPVSGTRITLAFSATTLANSYLSAATRVMSIYAPTSSPANEIACSTDNWSENCAGTGTYDETGSPIANDNIGTVEETWTLTFKSGTGTDFGVVGDTVGALADGTTGGDYSPSNADFSKPYFTLLSAGWAGTWADGDTIVWQSHPAAIAIWQKRVVPAGCGSLSGNKTTLVFGGES